MRKRTSCLLIILFLACKVARAGGFDLRINDVSGIDAPWPMVAGLPFPAGELKDPESVIMLVNGKEVACQVDVAARWRDGSIRWALAGFTASPAGSYRVEYKDGKRRQPHPAPLRVERNNSGFIVDTGKAVYEFNNISILPESASLLSSGDKIKFLGGSGTGAFLVDNKGRTARISGKNAQIENVVLKEGPGRLVLKRSGWYVTDDGEKIARGEVWIYFWAGTPNFKVTHSLVITGDTNDLWFKNYGLSFGTESSPREVLISAGKTGGKRKISRVKGNGGRVFMMQEEYPHFLERESRGITGREADGKSEILEQVESVGDWACGDYGDFRMSIVMPRLAERFPKEISFGPSGAEAFFWSGRSGRDLDFRSKTVLEEHYGTWGKDFYKPSWGGAARSIDQEKGNAQGYARTHDLWIVIDHPGSPESMGVLCEAASNEILAAADPEWLCKTNAMGYPMHHKDEKKFPAEEMLIREMWDRLEIPMKAFPVNGFLGWGMTPCRYEDQRGRIMMEWRSFFLGEYGMKRETWRHYGRSGERRYYDLGRKFSNFTGDWSIMRYDAPKKPKGTFPEARYVPFLWGDRTSNFIVHGGDIGHWLYDYYLTGNEFALEMVKMARESINKTWKEKPDVTTGTPFLSMRVLLTVAMLDWDPESVENLTRTVRGILDIKSQNGINLAANGGYGAEYKDHRASHNILEYYLETGDEAAKESFLKLVDQRYRFDRRENAVSYKNYDGFTYSMAYWLTGDERYRTVAEQALKDMSRYSAARPLAPQLSSRNPDPLTWNSLPDYLGSHEWHNPLIGIPTALKLVAEKGWSGKVTPLAVKSMDVVESMVVFRHEKGKQTFVRMVLHTVKENPQITIYSWPVTKPGISSPLISSPLTGIRVTLEKRMPPGSYFIKNRVEPGKPRQSYHAEVLLPGTFETGYYLLYTGGEEGFTVLDSTSEKVGLYSPEGFWSLSGGSMPYGRSGEAMPVFFNVPENTKNLEILLTRPSTVRKPDGSDALSAAASNIGNVSIPVKGEYGIWSLEPDITSFHGTCPPAFFKLLNVPPVISFGLPGLLPILPFTPAATAEDIKPSGSALQYVKGVSGQALRMTGGKKLEISVGRQLPSNGYEYLPGERGTVEFWFKADRSTYEIPVGEPISIIDQNFLSGPHLNLYHRYYVRRNIRGLYSTLRLEFLADPGRKPASGREVSHFFRSGRWTHVAYVWDIKEAGKGMDGSVQIFINGRLASAFSPMYGIKQFPAGGIFTLSKGGKSLVVGPFEGSIDMLRISDVARYTGDFTPPLQEPGIDEKTRIFFNFNGNAKGISFFSDVSPELN